MDNLFILTIVGGDKDFGKRNGAYSTSKSKYICKISKQQNILVFENGKY